MSGGRRAFRCAGAGVAALTGQPASGPGTEIFTKAELFALANLPGELG